MKYYRVRPEYDNHPIFKRNGNMLTPADVLIGNELYTKKELDKLFKTHTIGIIHAPVFEEIHIPKTRTFTMFGARFQIGHACA